MIFLHDKIKEFNSLVQNSIKNNQYNNKKENLDLNDMNESIKELITTHGDLLSKINNLITKLE